MGARLDFPLIVTGTDSKPLRLVCCAHNCGNTVEDVQAPLDDAIALAEAQS